MKLILKDFQDEAVIKLVRHLRSAAKDSRSGDNQAVSLSSATGSGKTVMLTRAIELLLEGDDDNAPVTDATFLWITDQPELNEQTRKKMLVTSTVLSSPTLVVLDATFDEETLLPATVHFLNIQKLGKDKGLVSRGDDRTYSLWEIIQNTIESRPGSFFVIIDEAHRGMNEEKGQAEAATIIQKFIKGSPGELPPVPIVLGVSATPERFTRLIAGTGRSHRPVDVDVDDVRKSGLIKDAIVLHHPNKEQPTDMTMLREAARSLKKFASRWSSYCSSNEDYEVVPLLVVQVEDARGKADISETDIGEAIRMLRDVLGNLSVGAFAHSFQEGAALEMGGEYIRYVAPSDIQSDYDVRVVFFKTSLNTGWDCPRAEVMMSFRTAADSTYIAQLVGRMVRTPLARQIIDNEFLNTVALYLPHYDAKGLKQVIDKLSRPDQDIIAPVAVESGEDVTDYSKATDSEQFFDALAKLPSYVVPRRRKSSQVRRLMKFARLLTNDDIDEDALQTATQRLISALNAEFRRLNRTKRFKEIVEDRGQIEIEAVNWDVGTESLREGKAVTVDIASENVDDLFEAAGRRLNEGLHKVWWRERATKEPQAIEKAKLELFALSTDPQVFQKVESTAQETVKKWLDSYRTEISDLDEGSRAAYQEIQSLASTPEETSNVYPTTIRGRIAKDPWGKHLYVNEDGVYTENFNGPETDILKEELARKEVVAWLRNTDRKSWALCVPYEVDGEWKAMYPDFLIIRTVKKRLIADIIDPHEITWADAPAKAAGLAKFAAKHVDKFGRIEMILLDGKNSKRLDLCDETVRNRVKAMTLQTQLRDLFDRL